MVFVVFKEDKITIWTVDSTIKRILFVFFHLERRRAGRDKEQLTDERQGK